MRDLLEEYDVMRREGFLEGDSATALRPSTLAGHVLGAYRLVSPIGQGGMGVVWLAERCDGQFERRAAVKMLEVRFGRSAARFRREANILARLTHPNIAHLIDAGSLLAAPGPRRLPPAVEGSCSRVRHAVQDPEQLGGSAVSAKNRN